MNRYLWCCIKSKCRNHGKVKKTTKHLRTVSQLRAKPHHRRTVKARRKLAQAIIQRLHVTMPPQPRALVRLWEQGKLQCNHLTIQVNWLHKFLWQSPLLNFLATVRINFLKANQYLCKISMALDCWVKDQGARTQRRKGKLRWSHDWTTQ